MGSPKISNIALVWFWLIVLAISCLSNAQNSPQDFVDAHNDARAQVNVGNLTWNSTVADYAQNYANQRKDDCSLVNSNGSYGEIISVQNDPFTGVDAVKRWISGKADYDYNSNTCRNGSALCFDYVQVVWGNTTQLGCARIQCPAGDFWFVICDYDPPKGQLPDQRPY